MNNGLTVSALARMALSFQTDENKDKATIKFKFNEEDLEIKSKSEVSVGKAAFIAMLMMERVEEALRESMRGED